MTDSPRIEFSENLKKRLKDFVLNLIIFSRELPNTYEANIIRKQVLRSGSSTYANYRATCRARSKAEFYSKLCIVVEEADETEMWLDLIIDSKINNSNSAKNLHLESLELLKILATAKKNSK